MEECQNIWTNTCLLVEDKATVYADPLPRVHAILGLDEEMRHLARIQDFPDRSAFQNPVVAAVILEIASVHSELSQVLFK